jgi:AcrR family transcriptional regulator
MIGQTAGCPLIGLATPGHGPHTPDVISAEPWYRLPVSRWSDGDVTATLQGRARTTRREILLAAARLFATHGFHKTSLAAVVEHAGHTKGALYFHFGSKSALGWSVVRELHASWDDIARRIAARGLDPLRSLLVRFDAHIAGLMHDPVVRGGLRVMREDPHGQDERHKSVGGWRAGTESVLAEASERGLLVAGADPAAISSTLLAALVGHHYLAESQPEGPTLWERMDETWTGLLTTVAAPEWLEGWRRSGWSQRPAPTRTQYERARDATAGTGTRSAGTDDV